MPPTSATPQGPDLAARAGYSVLELLIVLAIMALAAAVVLPQGALMLDRLVLHAVQFEFQREVSELRAEAYTSETPIELGSAKEKGADVRVLALRAEWTYRLDRPIRISAGGGLFSGARRDPEARPADDALAERGLGLPFHPAGLAE